MTGLIESDRASPDAHFLPPKRVYARLEARGPQ
jgi:hypothetical protein